MDEKIKKVEHVCHCGNEVCCMGKGDCACGSRRRVPEEKGCNEEEMNALK